MQTILERLGACAEAREWVGDRTLEQAWAECERPDWMLWIHARSKSADGHAYAALAKKWEAAAAARAAEADAAWARAARARAARAAEADAAWADAAWADAAWAAAARAAEAAAARAAEADAAWAALRVRQCDDIRAALCCPVFEDNK